MKTRKSTKRALLLSVCSILLCLVMLIGTTFAWFTDTASTAVNTIKSGTLDIVLEMKKADGAWESAEGKTLDFVKAANAPENEAILWEPGCTYTLPKLRIINNGKLALKYRVQINGIQGDAELNKAIEWKIDGADIALTEDHLLPEASKEFTLSGHMKEEAGNEYQGLTISGASIIVYATQYTYEFDSNNNTYDESAAYAIADGNTLKAVLAEGGNVTVSDTVKTSGEDTADARVIIGKPTTLTLNKKIVSPDDMGNNNTNFVALIVDADTTINAGANGGIDTGTNGGYAINVRNGATLTINGGSYYGGGTAVQVQKGTLVINGGFFAVEPYSNPVYGYEYLLNCIDGNYKDGTAKIIVKGGTFVNFNPSNNAAEGAGTNFVTDGYKVVSETKANGDTWYTVEKNPTAITYPDGKTEADFAEADKAMDAAGNTYTSFKEAFENVADGGELYLKKDSTVDFPTHLNVTKNITIYGNGADFSGKDISIGTYAAPENKETTVNIYNAKNLVVWGQPTDNLSDDCTWNVNFYSCENTGYNFLMYRGGESATAKINLTLTDCKATGFADSIVHATADGSIVIKNCTFENNCAPVNIAHKQSGTMTVTVEGCQFSSCGKIDTANDYFAPARFVNNSATGTLNVTLTNNTFTGTIGTNGDILLGDYRTGKESHALTATITTANPVMVKSSTEAAYSYNGGTITLN